MKKIIPIGISDFKKLIEGKYFFVDKSLVIKEFINNGADIMLTLSSLQLCLKEKL